MLSKIDNKKDSKSDIYIGKYTYDGYVRLVESFHHHVAPGVIIGGFMVDLAESQLPKGEIFDAICETRKCLPDAIQLLTPCTIGNGWLRVVHLGRFAMIFYEKEHGKGIRVFLDESKMDAWQEIKAWYFNLKPKKDQDSELLMRQIREAGLGILSWEEVIIRSEFLKKRPGSHNGMCPSCGQSELIPGVDLCQKCQKKIPYLI